MAHLLSPRIPLHRIPEACYFTELNVSRDGYTWFICYEGVQEYFDVPESATAIQLECNTKRVRHSLKVLEVNPDGGVVLVSGGDEVALSPEPLTAALKFWVKHGPFYVKCYYWE